jgi:hypothetical protein
MSELYQFEGWDGMQQSIEWYANYPNFTDLYYPIMTDGVGATLALLTTASEVL